MGIEIIVVTGAYGRQQVRDAGGQQALLPVISQAGADGVEIRRELFSEDEYQKLPALSAEIVHQGLTAYYSVPDTLFSAPGVINPHLQTYFAEAKILNARILKLSLGYPADSVTREQLTEALKESPAPVVIENDQTDGGRITPMVDFFSQFDGIPGLGGMTFDMGNWVWLGESPLTAADRLAGYVSYIHIKTALAHNNSFRAIPPSETDRQWQQLLATLPDNVPRGIEFPLEGRDLVAVTRHYVDILRHS